MRIPVNDNYSEKLMPHFAKAFNFLGKWACLGCKQLNRVLAGGIFTNTSLETALATLKLQCLGVLHSSSCISIGNFGSDYSASDQPTFLGGKTLCLAGLGGNMLTVYLRYAFVSRSFKLVFNF